MHPVYIAAQRVYFAVMREEPERLRKIPCRECICAVSGMDQAYGAFYRFVIKVQEEILGILQQHDLEIANVD